jgi:hypothetical protein
MILNEKVVNYKMADSFEYYNFNIKFDFIHLDLEKLWILFCSIYF